MCVQRELDILLCHNCAGIINWMRIKAIEWIEWKLGKCLLCKGNINIIFRVVVCSLWVCEFILAHLEVDEIFNGLLQTFEYPPVENHVNARRREGEPVRGGFPLAAVVHFLYRIGGGVLLVVNLNNKSKQNNVQSTNELHCRLISHSPLRASKLWSSHKHRRKNSISTQSWISWQVFASAMMDMRCPTPSKRAELGICRRTACQWRKQHLQPLKTNPDYQLNSTTTTTKSQKWYNNANLRSVIPFCH